MRAFRVPKLKKLRALYRFRQRLYRRVFWGYMGTTHFQLGSLYRFYHKKKKPYRPRDFTGNTKNTLSDNYRRGNF